MEEKVLLEATLCLLLEEDTLILALKKGKIGKDLLNGYGGGINVGETIKEAAVRELKEESAVAVLARHLKKRGIMDFHNTKQDGSTFTCRMHIYICRTWKGSPRETKEMGTPERFQINDVPLDRMLPADRVWLPQILSGKKIIGQAWYGPFQKELLREVEIKEVKSFAS